MKIEGVDPIKPRSAFKYFAKNQARRSGGISFYISMVFCIMASACKQCREYSGFPQAKTLVLIIFLSLLLERDCLTTAQLIIGNQKNCSMEGEAIDIPNITDDPCIRCFCKDKLIQCIKETCPPLACYVVTKRKNQCCPSCQGCTVGGISYQASILWKTNTDSYCKIQNCQNGIFTKSQIQCHASCANPLAPTDGECCPACLGCRVGGVRHYDAEEFPLPGHPCTRCLCKSDRVTCTRRTCPVRACGKRRTRMSSDGCCLECVGHRRVFALDNGDCWFQRKILPVNEKIIVDKCTTCVCKNGTVICDRVSCSLTKQCSSSKLVYERDQCCPACREEVFSNCTIKREKLGFVEKRKHGESWSHRDKPCEKCACNNGTITCSEMLCSIPTSCPPGQVMASVPGLCCMSCVSKPGICTVFGDPHYRTFDGRPFNFQGDCKYVLTKDCSGRNFSVVVQNDGKRSRSFSWTKTVYLRLPATELTPDIEISLHQRLIAKLDGRKMSLPYISAHVNVIIDKGFIHVITQRGVSLKWDGDSYLEVGASPLLKGELCGICGNYNGYTRDDFIGGDGLFKRDKNSFAESWRYGDNIFDCTRPSYDIRGKEPCSRSLSTKFRAREKCSVFKSKEFHQCYQVVDPVEYYKSCMTDTCECPKSKKCSCESIRAYSAACDRMGIILNWDKTLHCKTTCQRGKVYSSCGPPCKVTCRNHKNRRRNKRCRKRPCVAGCHCPAGQVLHKKRCVKVTSCSTRRLVRAEHMITGLEIRRKPYKRKLMDGT